MTMIRFLISRTAFAPINVSFQNAWRRSFSTKAKESLTEAKNFGSDDQTSSSTATEIAPDKHSVALLLIDVINHLDFEGNEELIKVIKPIGERISELRNAARQAGIPTIFVNDNYHKWKSDFRHVIQNVLEENKPGKVLAELLTPNENDYFVLKPKHSGFHCTPLELLLDDLKAKTLILTGFAGNICVLFTANDAYMRNYKLIVPKDCIGSNTPWENDACLEQIEKLLKADIRPSKDIINGIQNIINHAEQSTEKRNNKT